MQAKSAAGLASYRLAGFEMVALAPGETRHVSLTVDPRVIARFDESAPGWKIDAGTYTVAVGGFAGDRVISGTAQLDAVSAKP